MFDRKGVYTDYIRDIIGEIRNIEIFTNTISYEEFMDDIKTVYAVIRSLKIIGEAVKNIPQEIKEKYPMEENGRDER